jgi:hypothetical protein
MFAISLPINFNSPYKATSITDFWRRWHITLSRFLRDYLYIPLGGNRYGRVRRYVNLFLTMLLGGIWHGAGWTFVAWGALHGALLIAHHGFGALRKQFALPALPTPLAWLATIASVVIAWVPFRAPDFATTWRLWLDMAGVHGLGDLATLIELAGRKPVALTVLGCAAAVLLPNSQQLMWRYRSGLDSPGYPPAARWPVVGREALAGVPLLRRLTHGVLEWRPNLAGVAVLGALLGLALRMLNEPSSFIYFRF